MTIEPRYLHVKNWEKHQHYKSRDNAPYWIKLYPELLTDYSFLALSECERYKLLGIWMLAAKLRNRIPYDAKYVARVIGVRRVDLASFVSSGWLEVVDEHGRPASIPASRPSSTRRSHIEVEREEKREELEKDKEKALAVDEEETVDNTTKNSDGLTDPEEVKNIIKARFGERAA